MDEELPTEFDLVVIGTGFTESIVSAAASRIGKTVLHIDPNDYYGGHWASFNLENFIQFLDKNQNDNDEEKLYCIKNITQEWFISDTTVEDVVPQLDAEGLEIPDVKEIKNVWSKEKLLKESRKFSIDLTPKLLFSRGNLVELLISSNICRYTEFRSIDNIKTIINNKIMVVPCSRSDVFTNKDVNVIEKRLLMKLLTTCLNYDQNLTDNENEITKEILNFKEKTFYEYLLYKKLTKNLIHYILFSISMSNMTTNCLIGIERTKKFLNSLGRYGNSPFLFPMYGCGEIPQCFCRLSAVFGAVYCLKKSINNIERINDNELCLKTDKQNIKCKNIIMGNILLPNIDNLFIEENHETLITKDLNAKKCGNLSRGIFITTKRIDNNDEYGKFGGGVIFLRMPPIINDENTDKSNNGALVIQLSHYSGTCPKELYLTHIICESGETNDPKLDLEKYVNQILTEEKLNINNLDPTSTPEDENKKELSAKEPIILFSSYFTIPNCIKCSGTSNKKQLINGAHLCCGPYFELDYDLSIKQAKDIFEDIYKDSEFLPRAPDPDEIVLGDDNDNNEFVENNIFVENLNNADDTKLNDNISNIVNDIDNEEKCIEENNINESKINTN